MAGNLPSKVSKHHDEVPTSPYALMNAAVFGAIAFTAAVITFSTQSHKGLYALAAIFALIGVLLIVNLFVGDSDAKVPSAARLLMRAVMFSVLWILLLSKVREYVSNDLLWNLVLIVTLIVFLSFESLRRTTICILIFVFCYFLSIGFYESREELRSGQISGGLVFKDSATQMLSSRYVGKARALFYSRGYSQYAKAIDPRNSEVKSLAEKIVRGVPNKDKQELVYRIFAWVTQTIEYRSDPAGWLGEGDHIKPPLETIKSRAGDCDDSSVLLASLLESIGFNTYLVFIPGHVLVLVELEADVPSGKLGKPYGYIGGKPVFALESTKSRPVVGAPDSLLNAAPSDIIIMKSGISNVVKLDPKK